MTLQSTDRPRPVAHQFISQRLRLNYVDWGNASAPPLILVHGLNDHARSWDWVARELRNKWHVICPDLRGHGDSEWASEGDYAQWSFVPDLMALVDHLDLAPVTIVSHSLGANISLRFAGTYPEKLRQMVAIEGMDIPLKRYAEMQAEPIADRMAKWGAQKHKLTTQPIRRMASLNEAMARMKAANSQLRDDQIEHLARHGTKVNSDGSYEWKFDPCTRILAPFDITRSALEQLWGNIACPTLLISGADSTWDVAPNTDGRLQHFNTAKHVLIPQASHWAHLDQHDRVMAAVQDFLT